MHLEYEIPLPLLIAAIVALAAAMNDKTVNCRDASGEDFVCIEFLIDPRRRSGQIGMHRRTIAICAFLRRDDSAIHASSGGNGGQQMCRPNAIRVSFR